MRRREFITLIAGAVVGGRPLAVRAQRSDRVRWIGVLAFGAESDPSAQPWDNSRGALLGIQNGGRRVYKRL
jgi:hypothetical protein